MAKMGAFRFWCQKVLPLVYDDSISYYELLNKMVVYLNNVISDFNTVAENFDNLDDAFDTLQGSFNDTKNAMLHAYDQLQSYVNDYFDNLDVQAEINNKLDEMAEDGSLSRLLEPFITAQISADVAAWLQAHITPTSPAVDSSLTVAGAAADAKVTGDRIEDLKNVYLYKKAINDPHLNIGTAVNGNTGEVRTYAGNTTWVTSDYIPIPGEAVFVNSNFNQGVGGSTTYGFAIYDSSMQYITGGQDLSVIRILPDYKYIRMTNYNENSEHEGLYIVFTLKDSLPLVHKLIKANVDNVNFFDAVTVTRGGFLKADGTVYTHADYYYSDYIPVVSGNTYRITKPTKSNTNPGMLLYTGDFVLSETVIGTSYTVVIPDDIRYVRVNGLISEIDSQTFKKIESPAIDSTLSIAGAAADAKATGDRIEAVKSYFDDVYLYKKEINDPHLNIGTTVNANTGEVRTFEGNTTWVTSDYITIPSAAVFVNSNFNQGAGFTQTYGFAIYDSNMQYITGGQDLSVIRILPTYRYIRMTNYNENSEHAGLHIVFTLKDSLPLAHKLTEANVENVNFFDAATVTRGGFLKADGTVFTHASYYYSDYIPVVSGNTYGLTKPTKSNSHPGILLYNSDFVLSGTVSGTSYTVTIPANIRYVRINGLISEIGSQTFKKIENVPIIGKKVACYGDSLTWYDGNAFTWGPYEGQTCVGFESYIRNRFCANVFNVGMSGQTTPQICTRIVNANNFNLFDYLIIMGGDNDDRLNVPLGSLVESNSGATYDTTTVYGALQAAIELAFSNNAQLKIILMTEPQGWTYRNNALERVNDAIPEAYRRVAGYYGLPIIDNWNNSMVNFKTRNQYLADPADTENTLYMYHPNNFGWERISKYICDKLATI